MWDFHKDFHNSMFRAYRRKDFNSSKAEVKAHSNFT